METTDLIADNYVLLDGLNPVSDFIRFMKRTAKGGLALDDAQLTDEWRVANSRFREIGSMEHGFADTEELPGLPTHVLDYARTQLALVAARNGLSFLRHRWAMVELDRLVVYQKFINVTFADQIRRTLPERASEEDLIRIALGRDRKLPPIQVTQIDGNCFSFLSASNDIRILRLTPFDAEHIRDEMLRQSASSVLGIFVGYGSNLLQAVRIRNRTILTNGSHRAYALRAHGLTHVPCVVEEARDDELEFFGMAEVKQNFDRYITAPRPPLLKDYFDTRLHRIVAVPRRGVMFNVEVTIRQSAVPAF